MSYVEVVSGCTVQPAVDKGLSARLQRMTPFEITTECH